MRKIIFKPLDYSPALGLYALHPALTTEGRLISVIRRWAGSGGREARWRFDANALPAVQAARSRCASRASLGAEVGVANGAEASWLRRARYQGLLDYEVKHPRHVHDETPAAVDRQS